MLPKTKDFYTFGDFRLNLAEKTLWREGKVVALTPKVFETLLVFVENAGRLLEKDELMQKIWQDQFVEENNLTFNVKTLRRALGDDAQNPRFIETVPRRGYRFIAEVRRNSLENEVNGNGAKRGGFANWHQESKSEDLSKVERLHHLTFQTTVLGNPH